MSKEVKRYEAMLLEDNPRLQNLLPQGAILCGKKPVEVYLASDYDALLAERDGLAKAAQRVLDGLNARIDEAVMLGGPLPVFEGIADLHDALQGAQP